MILGKNEFQVPLYKHIADLSGQSNLFLPVPAFTVISGGKHAGNTLAAQVCSLLPEQVFIILFEDIYWRHLIAFIISTVDYKFMEKGHIFGITPLDSFFFHSAS